MCHQTVSLIARHLESVGIATVIIGSARDIVEECRVPRFVFTDLPLGNPCGPPNQTDAHDVTLRLALDLLEAAPGPQTTVQAPLRWPTQDWRDSYMRVDDTNRAALARAGAARRRQQQLARNDH